MSAIAARGVGASLAVGMTGAVVLLFGGSFVACGMCEPDRTPPATVDASTAPSPSVATAMPPIRPAVSAMSFPRRVPNCRAIAVDGKVTPAGDAGAAMAPQSEVHPDDWLVLAAAARLVVKDPRTARETTFRGPGRARACVDSSEESWIASGMFESSLGSGETPGAEEWVTTPLGVVRFATAKLAVLALPSAVQINVAEGVAFVWVAPDSASHADAGPPLKSVEDGWARVTGGTVTLDPPSPGHSPLDATRTMVKTCSALASTAHDLAGALLASASHGTSAEGGAAIATQQVAVRRLARAACAVASVRAASLPASDAGVELGAALSEATTMWQTLPVGR